jgi:hypothetical protein
MKLENHLEKVLKKHKPSQLVSFKNQDNYTAHNLSTQPVKTLQTLTPLSHHPAFE